MYGIKVISSPQIKHIASTGEWRCRLMHVTTYSVGHLKWGQLSLHFWW